MGWTAYQKLPYKREDARRLIAQSLACIMKKFIQIVLHLLSDVIISSEAVLVLHLIY